MSGLQVTWLKRGKRGADARPLLNLEELKVRVGARRVLDGVDLEVHAGDHARITSPNGYGKSTLFNAIAGVESAHVEGGRIRFEGADITSLPAHERARQGIIYMRQVDNVFLGLTVGENLKIALGQNGYKTFAGKFPEWAADLKQDIRAGQLSGGQCRQLAYAMAVLHLGTRILLLDEPRSGMSLESLVAIPVSEKGVILEVEH